MLILVSGDLRTPLLVSLMGTEIREHDGDGLAWDAAGAAGLLLRVWTRGLAGGGQKVAGPAAGTAEGRAGGGGRVQGG